ncbi:MAG TPA: siderophore-interacting protein [Natronosporangium sp.]
MAHQGVVAPWRLFAVEVAEVRELSPSFLRVSFAGPDLAGFADNGYDQRIKLVLPVPGHGLAHLPTGPDWYQRWRALPDALRNPIRTYTVRRVRQAPPRVDVDIVRHGGGHGPVARWAAVVRPGDQAMLVGPDAGYPGDHGGVEFRPPAPGTPMLIAGDETAVPAVAAILERLPADARGEVLLEVPYPADTLTLAAPPGLAVSWLPRSGQPHGSRLVPAVRAAAGRLLGENPEPMGGPVEDVDVDTELLWEVPEGDPAGVYAWLAGEAGVIRTLRRHLVSERGVDRRSVAFMGYWRLGRAEGE